MPKLPSVVEANTSINQQVAARLYEMADLLQQQAATPDRVAAYRNAAASVAALQDNLHDILDRNGIDGLIALPNIERGIAVAMCEQLHTGHWSELARLRGDLDQERLFQIIPGVGPELAKCIHDTLQIDSLAALQQASHNGQLELVEGIGANRLSMIRGAIENIFCRQHDHQGRSVEEPPIKSLLDVDREYRTKAMANKLPTIAPKYCNPDGTARLPILHTQRNQWHFTVLFSNTALAHKMGRTREWVVIYFYQGFQEKGQHTIVTGNRGPLIGRRVIRGHERESWEYYLETSK